MRGDKPDNQQVRLWAWYPPPAEKHRSLQNLDPALQRLHERSQVVSQHYRLDSCMLVSPCVYDYVHLYKCARKWARLSLCVSVYMRVFVSMCVMCVGVSVCVCVFVFVSVCVSFLHLVISLTKCIVIVSGQKPGGVCMCVCLSVCLCVCVCVCVCVQSRLAKLLGRF